MSHQWSHLCDPGSRPRTGRSRGDRTVPESHPSVRAPRVPPPSDFRCRPGRDLGPRETRSPLRARSSLDPDTITPSQVSTPYREGRDVGATCLRGTGTRRVTPTRGACRQRRGCATPMSHTSATRGTSTQPSTAHVHRSPRPGHPLPPLGLGSCSPEKGPNRVGCPLPLGGTPTHPSTRSRGRPVTPTHRGHAPVPSSPSSTSTRVRPSRATGTASGRVGRRGGRDHPTRVPTGVCPAPYGTTTVTCGPSGPLCPTPTTRPGGAHRAVEGHCLGDRTPDGRGTCLLRSVIVPTRTRWVGCTWSLYTGLPLHTRRSLGLGLEDGRSVLSTEGSPEVRVGSNRIRPFPVPIPVPVPVPIRIVLGVGSTSGPGSTRRLPSLSARGRVTEV